MADGFLGRWSRRKLDVSKPQDLPPSQPISPADSTVVAAPAIDASGKAGDLRAQSGPAGPAEPPPPPTLEDVQALTAESDFSRFASADVAPDVKNAAMKKLFSDPRYNVMDRMDVYIDDYSKPDPIPAAMLRQLASAKFLGLFDQEEKEEKEEKEEREAAQRARDVADNPTEQSVAQSDATPPAVPEPPLNADPDLRLQQDHAAPGKDPGHGTG